MVSAWRQRSLRLDLVHWDTKISISALLYRLYCFFSNGEKNKKWKVHFSFLNGDMAVSYSFVETSLQFTYQFSLYTSRGAVSISTFFHFTLTIRFLLSLFWRVFFFYSFLLNILPSLLTHWLLSFWSPFIFAFCQFLQSCCICLSTLVMTLRFYIFWNLSSTFFLSVYLHLVFLFFYSIIVLFLKPSLTLFVFHL